MTKGRRTGFLLFSAIAILCLVLLGSWQLYRMQWKNDLIEKSAAALTAEPVSIHDIEAGLEHGYDVDLLRTRLTGTYRYDVEHYIYFPKGRQTGYRLITPFIDEKGYVTLIDRGWIPQDMLAADKRIGWRKPQGTITITGLTRAHAAKGIFIPEPDRKKNIWYSHDLVGMVSTLPKDIGAMPDGQTAITSSLFVQLEPGGEPGDGAWPKIPPAKVSLPNNHLQYAITWYSLAAFLVAMTVLFMRKS